MGASVRHNNIHCVCDLQNFVVRFCVFIGFHFGCQLYSKELDENQVSLLVGGHHVTHIVLFCFDLRIREHHPGGDQTGWLFL